MKQYPGWEKGEGGHGAGGVDVVETGGDEGAAQVANHWLLPPSSLRELHQNSA